MHSAGALLHGKPLEGYWFDRTKEYAARNRGEEFGVMEYATREELVLSPLPCWKYLSRSSTGNGWPTLSRIEAEGRAERESKELAPLGVEATCYYRCSRIYPVNPDKYGVISRSVPFRRTIHDYESHPEEHGHDSR